MIFHVFFMRFCYFRALVTVHANQIWSVDRPSWPNIFQKNFPKRVFKASNTMHCLPVLVVKNMILTSLCFEVLNFLNMEELKKFIDTIRSCQIHIFQESLLTSVKRIWFKFVFLFWTHEMLYKFSDKISHQKCLLKELWF